MPHQDNQPARVAILGGGCASMAAAFELSRPEHQGRYRVTVYQQGWRLGGKGASGRGPNDRVEEHGLHVWMGWYENAFGLLRECYGELGRDWRKAFEPAPLIAVTDEIADGGWKPWTRLLPPAEGLPGDPRKDTSAWTVRGYLTRSIQLLQALVAGIDRGGSKDAESLRDLLANLAHYGEIATLSAITQAVTTLEAVVGSADEHPDSSVLAVIDAIGEATRHSLETRLEADIETRRIWQVIDLLLATIRGNIRSGLLTDPRGFDAIDEYDCREWLLLNGASQSSVDSAYLRGLYDLGFAYENGDPEKPSVSAAQALRGFLRAFFTYRGSFFWKMNAGMGDVVFAPLYESLSHRGVRFRFFHRLKNVRLNGHTGDGETPHVSALEFDVQARIKGGASYQPLVDVKGLPCWPSMPDFDQLEDGDRLLQENRRFESHWDERHEETRILDVEKDFDFVVFGIGIGAVPYVCSELVAYDPRWRAMVDHVKTVATQAFQLWLQPSTEELGWPGPPITLSGFAKPFETWADMGHLLDMESWPEPPGALAYFCGALPDTGDPGPSHPDYEDSRTELVRQNVTRYLHKNIRHLWPGAVDEEGRFRWELLIPADGQPKSEPLTGEARLASQYLRANVNPTDRYTLSLPGSSAYRISPLDPTYDNFVVCGDWTDCGFNSGCVEAAVMSGRLAAHALSTKPALEDIVGYDHP